MADCCVLLMLWTQMALLLQNDSCNFFSVKATTHTEGESKNVLHPNGINLATRLLAVRCVTL